MTSPACRPLLSWVFIGIAAFALLCAATPPALADTTTGSGKGASDMRAIAAEFDAIAIAGAMDLVVRQGAKQAVELRADDNLLPLIETVVESSSRGPTLVVRVRRGEHIRPRTDVRVIVDVVKLAQIHASGTGDVVVQALKTPSLRLLLSGAGDAKVHELTTDAFEVRVAGSGNVDATGSAKQVKLTIAGSGNVTLKNLPADDVTVSIAGSGDARVVANRALGVTIAGSGDVEYSGEPATLRTSVVGSGRVSKR